VSKYCEFYERIEHTTAECKECRKALHEFADKGQIDRFFEKGSTVPPEGAETPAAKTTGRRMLYRDRSYYRWWMR